MKFIPVAFVVHAVRSWRWLATPWTVWRCWPASSTMPGIASVTGTARCRTKNQGTSSHLCGRTLQTAAQKWGRGFAGP